MTKPGVTLTGESRPARGGRIEMTLTLHRTDPYRGPAPHGAGGLKFSPPYALIAVILRPAPHGAGGLKCPHRETARRFGQVPPRTGRAD